MTPEDFKIKYGMTKEEYAILRKSQGVDLMATKKPAVTPAPVPDDIEYLPDYVGPAQTREITPVNAQGKLTTLDGDQLGPYDLPEPHQTAPAMLALGIGTLPAVPLGLAGIVDVTARSMKDVVMDGSSFGDAFSKNIMGEEGIAALGKLADDKIKQFLQDNPNATKEELEHFNADLHGSPEFWDEQQKYIHPLLKVNNDLSKAVMEFNGDDRTPAELSWTEDAVSILGSTIIGAPAGGIGKAANKIGLGAALKTINKGLQHNALTRGVGYLAEVATPLTLNYSAGRVAANTAVGIGLNSVMRNLQGLPVGTSEETTEYFHRKIDEQAEANPIMKLPMNAFINASAQQEQNDRYRQQNETMLVPEQPVPDGGTIARIKADMTAHDPSIQKESDDLYMAMVIFSPRQVARVVGNGLKRGVAGAPTVATTAGPSLKNQSTTPKPQLSPLTGILNENAPLTGIAQKFGSAEDVMMVDALRSAASNANVKNNFNNLYNYGMLDNMPNTVSLAQLNKQFGRLSKADRPELENYLHAIARQQDNAINAGRLNKQMADTHSVAQTYGNQQTTAANNARRAFYDAVREYEAFVKDTKFKGSTDSTEFMPARPSFSDWSKADVNDIVVRGNSRPEFVAIKNNISKYSQDIVDFLHKNHVISAEDAIRMKADRPMYFPLMERADADILGRRIRGAKATIEDVLHTLEGHSGEGVATRSTALRDVTGRGSLVNRPTTVDYALSQMGMDATRNVALNNARRDIIGTMKTFPDFNKFAVQVPFESNGRVISAMTPSQLKEFKGTKQYRPDDIEVWTNGRASVYRFGDPAIANSLKFSPAASVAVLNGTRKAFQWGTTGPGNPLFAAKNVSWDMMATALTKQDNRSFGMIDQGIRSATMGTSMEGVGRVMANAVIDPTAILQTGGSMATLAYQKFRRSLATKIADDLAFSNGITNILAPQGSFSRQVLESAAQSMIQKYEQSTAAVFQKHLSASVNVMQDAYVSAREFEQAAAGSRGIASRMYSSYTSMLDCINGASKYAFFAQNYQLLLKKHGGTIPKNELIKLIHETRSSAGDMTRVAGSKVTQNIASTTPYFMATINGTRQMLSAAAPKAVKRGINAAIGTNLSTTGSTSFWARTATGVVIPSIYSLYLVENWDGASDYWYNKIPEYERMGGILLPTIETLAEVLETGTWPKFTPDKSFMVQIPPEIMPIREAAMEGARALGLVPAFGSSYPTDGWERIRDVLDQQTNLVTMPVAGAGANAAGYRLNLHGAMSPNQNVLTPLSDPKGNTVGNEGFHRNAVIPNRLFAAIGSLYGTAGTVAATVLDAGALSLKDTGDFSKALEKMFDIGKTEATSRVARVSPFSTNILWDAERRLGMNTPESRYVYNTENKLENIFLQASVEKDLKGRGAVEAAAGLEVANRVQDKGIKQLAVIISAAINQKGPYKNATAAQTFYKSALAGVDGARHRMTEKEYMDKRNELVSKLNEVMDYKSQALQMVELGLQQKYGQQFEAVYGIPLTFDNFIDVMKKDLDR